MPTCQWTAPAAARQSSEVRRLAVAYAAGEGVRGDALTDIRLALSEALTNVVLHAFRGRAPGTLRLRVTIDPDTQELEAVVADDGMGIAPRPDSPGMGVGMPLMASVSKAIEIRVPEGGRGTEVVLRFDVAPLAAVREDRPMAAAGAQRSSA